MKESKKLLIGFAVMGVICCLMAGVGYWGLRQFGRRVENMANGDPTTVAQIQEKIADFDAPPGYRTMAMSMFIYDTVYLTPEDAGGAPTIMLMQYSTLTSANREQLEQGLREAAQEQSQQPGVSTQVVDSFEAVVRGETVTVTVSESNTQGFIFRQWLTIFEGNNGPVIFMAQGFAQEWDDQLLKDFLQSIR
jgi:hypothetical protein